MIYNDYKKLQQIGISFSEFYKKRQDIDYMLITHKLYAEYWLGETAASASGPSAHNR